MKTFGLCFLFLLTTTVLSNTADSTNSPLLSDSTLRPIDTATIANPQTIQPEAVTTPPDSTPTPIPLKSPKRTMVKDKASAEKEIDVITAYKGDVNELKSPKKAFFLSFLLPGLGEYYAKAHPARIVAPITLEVATYVVAYVFYQKYLDATSTYKKHADLWFDDAKFRAWYQAVIDTNDKSLLMPKGSHDSLYKTEQPNKSNDYYEMVAKYDIFTQGWKDADPDLMKDDYMHNVAHRNRLGGSNNDSIAQFATRAIDTVIMDGKNIKEVKYFYYHDDDPNRPQTFGRSIQQLENMKLRDQANIQADYARKTLYALIVNRIISAVDAVLAANSYNRKLTGNTLTYIDKLNFSPLRVGTDAVATNGVRVGYAF